MVIDERIRLLFPRILSFVAIAAVLGAGYGYETADAGLRGLIRGATVDIGAFQTSLVVESTEGVVDTDAAQLTLAGAVSRTVAHLDSCHSRDSRPGSVGSGHRPSP